MVTEAVASEVAVEASVASVAEASAVEASVASVAEASAAEALAEAGKLQLDSLREWR